MKVIVAGSRSIGAYSQVEEAIAESGFQVSEVVSGAAQGVDRWGILWAGLHKVPVSVFHAKWEKFGKAAGPVRNREMAAYGEALVAVWDGESRGTRNMIAEAQKRGLPTFIKRPELKEAS